MSDKFDISVTSEIGVLEGVVLHKPGLEVENMTPKNIKRALYSDILNLTVASKEYAPAQRGTEKNDACLLRTGPVEGRAQRPR